MVDGIVYAALPGYAFHDNPIVGVCVLRLVAFCIVLLAKAQQNAIMRHFPVPSGQPKMMHKNFMRIAFVSIVVRCKAHEVLCRECPVDCFAQFHMDEAFTPSEIYKKEVCSTFMDMIQILFIIVGIAVGLALGFVLGMLYRKKVAGLRSAPPRPRLPG